MIGTGSDFKAAVIRVCQQVCRCPLLMSGLNFYGWHQELSRSEIGRIQMMPPQDKIQHGIDRQRLAFAPE